MNEAIGITKACKSLGIPFVCSFTTETDGSLPSGQLLKDAVEQVDRETDCYPSYFTINCSHPSHFLPVIEANVGQSWLGRLRGLNGNASKKSHGELDNCTELDFGDPVEFGQLNARLKELNPAFNEFGGCCGSDIRHVTEVFKILTA